MNLVLISACLCLFITELVISCQQQQQHKFDLIEAGIKFLRLTSEQSSDLLIQQNIRQRLDEIYNLIKQTEEQSRTTKKIFCIYSEHFLNTVLTFKATKTRKKHHKKTANLHELSPQIIHFMNTVYNFTKIEIPTPVEIKSIERNITKSTTTITEPLNCPGKKHIGI